MWMNCKNLHTNADAISNKYKCCPEYIIYVESWSTLVCMDTFWLLTLRRHRRINNIYFLLFLSGFSSFLINYYYFFRVFFIFKNFNYYYFFSNFSFFIFLFFSNFLNYFSDFIQFFKGRRHCPVGACEHVFAFCFHACDFLAVFPHRHRREVLGPRPHPPPVSPSCHRRRTCRTCPRTPFESHPFCRSCSCRTRLASTTYTWERKVLHISFFNTI